MLLLFFLFCYLILIQCWNLPLKMRTSLLKRYTVNFVGDSDSAVRRLHLDQQMAKARRADAEKGLLVEGTELLQPLLGSKLSKVGVSKFLIAREWAKILRSEGVIRINNCVGVATALALREMTLLYLVDVKEKIAAGSIDDPNALLGMEIHRKCRNELLLSLTKEERLGNPVADMLSELFGDLGTIRELYEVLLTKRAVLYDLCTIVTEPGSDRQQIHADMPCHAKPPLFSIFVALQDVTMEMGPTTFLSKTNTQSAHDRWREGHAAGDALFTPSYALLKVGDIVVYDPRVLHCGGANEVVGGAVRAMFNLGFRDPSFLGSMGYAGSLRPSYKNLITLGDISVALKGYVKAEKNSADPFKAFGCGLHEKL